MKLKLNLRLFLVSSIIILIGVILYLLSDSNIEIQGRTRTLFNIPPYTTVNETSIKSSILSKISLGSSKKVVYAFIEKIGLNRDRLSSCQSITDNREELRCTIRFDDKKIAFSIYTIVTYDISFYFDLQNKLEEVNVRQTGAML